MNASETLTASKYDYHEVLVTPFLVQVGVEALTQLGDITTAIKKIEDDGYDGHENAVFGLLLRIDQLTQGLLGILDKNFGPAPRDIYRTVYGVDLEEEVSHD